MRRGQIWRYSPAITRPGAPLLRLIISADAINADDTLPVVLAVTIVGDDPGSLLAVRVGAHGWARALSIEPVMRSRLAELVDQADADTLDQLGAALRAAQDL